MSSTQRVFYVVYLPAGEFRTCLDALRVIARPQTRFPAHLTVRGPYAEAADVSPHSDRIRDAIVRIAGVGIFDGAGQNTVFLHCSCPDLLSVWDKPDYGYNPHITLYDGDSLDFAEALYDVLEQAQLRHSFRARGLEPLVSRRGDTAPPVRDRLDSAALAEIFGVWPSTVDIDAMDDGQRLEWVARIAHHLGCADKTSILV